MAGHQYSQASRIVQQEIGYAFGTKKYIIPVVVGDAIPDGMALNVEYIRLDPAFPFPSLQNLADFLKRMIEQNRKNGWYALGALALGAAAFWYLSKNNEEED